MPPRPACLCITALLLLLCGNLLLAQQIETRVWDGTPITVELPVKAERIVRLQGSSSLHVGVPKKIQGLLSIESLDGVLYMRASEAFARERLIVMDKQTGEVFLLDVLARRDGPVVQMMINTAAPPPDEALVVTAEPPAPILDAPPLLLGHPALVQVAMQSVYAPKRLIERPAGLIVMRAQDHGEYERLVPGAQIIATVLAQWQYEGIFITALYLQNQASAEAVIDPRYIRGARYWEVAALMHNTLAPVQYAGSATTLVVISTERWEDYSPWLK